MTMRGFGVEKTDERWVELRRSTSGTVRLVAVSRGGGATELGASFSGTAWEVIRDDLATWLSRELVVSPRTWSTQSTRIRWDLGQRIRELFGAISLLPQSTFAWRAGTPDHTRYTASVWNAFERWLEPEPENPDLEGHQTYTAREWKHHSRDAAPALAAAIRSGMGNSRGDEPVTLLITQRVDGYQATRIEPWDRPIETSAAAAIGGGR